MGRAEYIVCPLCGLNRVLRSKGRAEKGKPEIARFNSMRLPEIEEMPILQVREGGGKKPGKWGKRGRGGAPGRGFKTVETYTIKDLMENPEYEEILQDLKAQYLRVLKGFVRTGFIKPEEVREAIT